ncbi:MAG: IclR family transcriptional regulator [Candidatus Sumerlaeota bacterium]
MSQTKPRSSQTSPSQPYQSLGAGIDVLLALAMSKEPVGSRPLSRKLNIEATKVNRLLGTLASLGLARKTEQRQYVIGPGIHVLAAMSLRGSHLFSSALPVLEELQAETGLLVALGVLWRREVCYLFHCPPESPVEFNVAARDLFPAEKSAIGLALFAEDGSNRFQEYYTAQEVETIHARIQKTQKEGYALAPDSVSMAVAVGSPGLAGLAVANDGQKLTAAQQREYYKALKQAAKKIAEHI